MTLSEAIGILISLASLVYEIAKDIRDSKSKK